VILKPRLTPYTNITTAWQGKKTLQNLGQEAVPIARRRNVDWWAEQRRFYQGS
jgi:hypothetical protein